MKLLIKTHNNRTCYCAVDIDLDYLEKHINLIKDYNDVKAIVLKQNADFFEDDDLDFDSDFIIVNTYPERSVYKTTLTGLHLYSDKGFFVFADSQWRLKLETLEINYKDLVDAINGCTTK